MDFKYAYTKEQEEFRKEVRAWLKENIPDEMRSPVDRLDLTDEHYKFWRDMHPKLAEKGWLYPTYPKEYGGGGLSGEHETILLEEFELARVVHDFTNPFVFATLLVWATEEQKQKFLVPLLKADKVAFQNFTEPNAGSDLASLQSRAVRDGDDWIITGQKIFISGHGEPDWLFGPIMTDPDAPRHRNLGYFMIPYPSPGLELSRLNLLTGHDQSFFFMDNVRVPGDHLIGGEQQGWQVTQTTLEIEHGGRGVAFPRDESMDNLLKYVQETKSNGRDPGKRSYRPAGRHGSLYRVPHLHSLRPAQLLDVSGPPGDELPRLPSRPVPQNIPNEERRPGPRHHGHVLLVGSQRAPRPLRRRA